MGKQTLTEVHDCPSESNLILPLCSLTMLNTMESPSPVPLPGSLVVKNGSKMLFMFLSEIPDPVSVKIMMLSLLSRSTMVSIVMLPSPFMACMAFERRLVNN